MSRFGSLVALAALVFATAPAAIGQPPFERREPQAPLEQPVEVAAQINPGDTWTYHFGLNQTSTRQKLTPERENDGPLQTFMLIQNATVTLRVAEIDEESGTASIEASFDRLLTIQGTDEGQREYRWASGDTPAEPATDLARLLSALTGSTLTARVSARGSVRGVVGFDAVNAVLAEHPEADRAALGLFAPAAIEQTLGMLWQPAGVSGAERNVQDTWSSDRRASLGHAGGIAVEHTLTVDRIEDGILKASGTTELRALPPQETQSGAGIPEIDLIRGTGKARISWDLDRGCAASASERLDLEAVWTLGPANLGVTMRSERSAALDVPPKGTRKPGEG